jgi:hypothetical protein
MRLICDVNHKDEKHTKEPHFKSTQINTSLHLNEVLDLQNNRLVLIIIFQILNHISLLVRKNQL